MTSQRLVQFNSELSRARDLVGLGQSLGSLTHGRVNAADIFRAALTHGVAALDTYIHGVVLDRAVDVVLGRVQGATSGAKVGLHFAAIQDILMATSPIDRELIARTYVAERLSLETYQRPDDVANGFAMVGVKKIWSSAFTDPESAKTALSLVVRRRNRIVHQCDTDPVTPSVPIPLSDADALDAIATIQSTVIAIDAIL
jgi:hypothetical protein